MNVPKSKRRGHQDARAAAYILQDYLDCSHFKSNIKRKINRRIKRSGRNSRIGGIQNGLPDSERLGKKKNRRSKKILGVVLILSVLFLAVHFNGVKKKVENVIGPASPALSRFQQFRLITQLEPELTRLMEPASDKTDQTLLSVRPGETPAEIARELKKNKFYPMRIFSSISDL
jgi:hypothetical protein